MKAPYGQIELDELPEMKFLSSDTRGKKASNDNMNDIIEYLKVG